MRARTLEIDALSKKAHRTELRALLNAVFARASALGLFPVAYAAGALTLIKVFHPSAAFERALVWGFGIPAVVFVGGLLAAVFKRRPPLAGALALDRAHDLRDRVTNALEFSDVPEGSRTPLMQAAIEDAVALARDASPRRAVPLEMPRDLPALAVLAIATAGISFLEVPVRRVVPPPAPHVDAFAVTPDDAELFRKMGDELTTATTDPAAAAGVRRFNQIIEDLAARRLDRTEVFRRLDEVARSMKDPLGVDPSALDEAFNGIAKELGKSAMSKPVADALAAGHLSDAEQAMRDLAKKVEEAKKDVDKAKLDALRDSMKKAAETVQNRAESQKAERQSLEETRKRLLEKKKKEGLNAAEQKELDRTERQLEHLDREKAKSDAQQQALSGLDKDLQKAAQDLMKDLGQSSQDVKQGAEDMNRAAQKQMSEAQKKELLRKIEELRQILRQEGQAGKDRIKRMLAFGQSARGQSGQGGGSKSGGKGDPSAGNGGSGKEGGQGNGPGGERLMLSPGAPGPGQGAMVMMPGGSEGSGEPDPSKGGGAASQGGSEWGTGHDPNLAGKQTALKGHTEDTTAAGADTGQGAAASEVIYGAAQRGFVGHGYKKVFTDYQTVAEEALGHDEIPPGYRFYIRRYFQLIRPRD